MAYKLINATEARSGASIMIENFPYTIRSNDISKTGKHGHAKCRIEAINILDGKKKVLAVNGHERFECPIVNKNKAQVLSINKENANVMDLASYESFEIPIPEELKNSLKEEDQIEYWDIEGNKIIKRKF